MRAGLVEDLFIMVNNASKGKRGPLAVLTELIGAFLGAVSGSGTATSASLGQVVVPQLVKYGYQEDLAGIVAASAGSLSGIIPPTVILILYGSITETPISTLFMAAVIPGLILTSCYNGLTMYYLKKDSKKAHSSETKFEFIPMPTKTKVLTLGISLAIVLIVFVGIYSGFFTPTEAAAVGSLATFIAAAGLGKVDKSFIWDSLKETVKVTAMVMLIIISAKFFARFISLSLLPRKLIVALQPLMDRPWIILTFCGALYFVLFALLEGSAAIVMTVPILLPIMQAMNMDVIWFGIFICVFAVVGQLTPPVGMSVYAVCGVSGLNMGKVFKYGMKYAIVACIVAGFLLIAFPQITSWLPSLMK
jgi:tripartite ATP-independent transporter DctM subunit